MANLATYFDTAYLINLDERVDRLRETQVELQAVGFEEAVERFSAVKFAEAEGFENAGTRGCFHSHLNCLENAVKRESEHVLVLEDDVAFSPALATLTPQVTAFLDKNEWDIVYFGHMQTGDIAHAKKSDEQVEFLPFDREMIGLHFYAVHKRAMGRLIEHMRKCVEETDWEGGIFHPMSPDGALNVFRRENKDICALIASPKLGWQRASKSDLTPSAAEKIPGLNKILPGARKVKNWLKKLT